jgi:hypothetical protein
LKNDPVILPAAPTAKARIKSPSKRKLLRTKLKKIAGTASATGGDVAKVEVAVLKSGPRKSKKCRWLRSSKAKFRSVRKTKSGCTKPVWLKANGTTKWSFKLKKSLPAGKYKIYARATPVGGSAGTSFTRAAGSLRSLTLTR